MKRTQISVKKVVVNVLWITLLLCLIGATLFSVIQRLNGNKQPMVFGWGGAVVLTGSMEPNISAGSLIIIHEKDDYELGDIVAYIDETGRSVTHRIVVIADDTIVTRGDANNVADTPFDKSQIIGCVQFVIPGVGKYWHIVIIAMLLLAGGFLFLHDHMTRKAGHNHENEIKQS